MTLDLLRGRAFLPIFATQALGAFNDNLFKNAVVLLAVFGMYSDARHQERFGALVTAAYFVPFLLLSAVAGQAADALDKARIVRVVKLAELGIMLLGGVGLVLASVPVMLGAMLLMGVHSTVFSPVKYAILPQHLPPERVLGAVGLVEAGNYAAILGGTVLAGLLSPGQTAVGVLAVAVVGVVAGWCVPSAPPVAGAARRIDRNPLRALVRVAAEVAARPTLALAVLAIGAFWAIGAVLFIQFPPLVRNVLHADKSVASLFLALVSVGVAIGGLLSDRLLGGRGSARLAPVAMLAVGGCVLVLDLVARRWSPGAAVLSAPAFLMRGDAYALLGALFALALAGGLYVVPLYAHLATTADRAATARAIAATNIANGGAMTIGSGVAIGLASLGVGALDELLVVAALCPGAAWLARRLALLERGGDAADG